MQKLIRKAAEYSPEVLADFVDDLWAELDIEGKATFKLVLHRFFLDEGNVPPDKEN